eukprot:CAMPEP_0113311462 /NCGR_PEP_ID=MMETSP0010_2-20120614/8687_1 /TAXON_ID=216773 ORGANISM="Corethron hystrix, Strain 308" /NCGR_SAMPLE_ID=MMETSP0010_2 /ASSEMBLY_ACC=CAM_ASM_000155 /LENGTH=339 /DNA_ID=CAMNT_0000167101 /DNA_START=37 /DNA_END=1056 /DNA_ORIENTATION=- /assembly_acc=CAM_ASM_000155
MNHDRTDTFTKKKTKKGISMFRNASSKNAPAASAAPTPNVSSATADQPAKTLRIAFAGSGMMATAMIDGLLSSGAVSGPSDIFTYDSWIEARRKMSERGIMVVKGNRDLLLAQPDAIVIAVKPAGVASVCQDLTSVLTGPNPPPIPQAILSIAAGVTLGVISSHLPDHVHPRIVRVMPNTPALIGMGASAYCTPEGSPQSSCDVANRILSSVGEIALHLPEHNMDAVTGVSGSGPAYVYAFIEALSDGGVRAGLPRQAATALAVQTVRGSAEMVLRTGKHTGELKEMVTSPGGTTIAGVHALEQGGLRGTMMDAVVATTRRSMQLGGKSEEEIRDKCGL